MGWIGDLLGGMFGDAGAGAGGDIGEGIGGLLGAFFGGNEGGGGREGYNMTETYERVLAGRRKTLDVNDR